MTETDSSTRIKGTVSKSEVTSTVVAEDVAEDVDAAQPEANARHTEVDTTTTHTGIVRTREESARTAQKATKKQLDSPT